MRVEWPQRLVLNQRDYPQRLVEFAGVCFQIHQRPASPQREMNLCEGKMDATINQRKTEKD